MREYIHVADGVIRWFVKRLDGFMVSKSNLWDFIDWSEGYKKGQINCSGPITVYSLMLAYTLEKLSEMHKMLGNNTDEFIVLSEKIKEDVKARCFDEEKGLYADSPAKTHFAQHPQIWAVLCGIETGDKAKELLNKSMKLTSKVTSAYMFILFRAFEKADMYDATKDCIDALRGLVKLGCTTTPEWIGENVRSECHAWSAVAIYEFTAKVLGVTYRNNTVNIAPYIKGRSYAKGEVATPDGMVYCEWKSENDKFTISIKVPDGKTALLTMPDGSVLQAESGEYGCKLLTDL